MYKCNCKEKIINKIDTDLKILQSERDKILNKELITNEDYWNLAGYLDIIRKFYLFKSDIICGRLLDD